MRRAIVFLLVSVSLLWLPSLAISADNEQPKEQKKELQEAQQGKEQGKEQVDPAKRILVKIGGIAITEQEFNLQFRAAIEKFPADKRNMFMNPHGRKQLLDMLVDQKVWVNWALEENLDRDPEVTLLVNMSRDQILIRKAYEKMVAMVAPTETEVRKFYDENRAKFKGPIKARVRHILLADSTEAKQVLAQLKAGADFAKLAKEKSKDGSTANSGGEVGFITQGAAVPAPVGGDPALEAAIFSLKAGGLSEVIKSGEDYQIINVEERIEPEIMPFESVKQRIEEGLSGERVNAMRSELFQEIKTKFPAEYLIEDSSVAASKNVSPPGVANTPEELFQAAMDSKASGQRIGIYEELLRKFPESKYAAQAQFMIGFIYSEELKDYAKAEAAFRVVTEKYPESELVDSAKWMIKNMRDESQKVGTVEDVKRKAKESKDSKK
ncbi:MAG: peptidyl-prolyl cis-trans isomerase [Candidatus Eisenbacteria bacterium]|nr:peptidyl-prolyl cis-trans isomerase [Candidatus Eisenbacteria bacterium]